MNNISTYIYNIDIFFDIADCNVVFFESIENFFMLNRQSDDEMILSQTNPEATRPNLPKSDRRRRLSLEEKTLLKQMRKQKAEFHQRIRQLTGPSNDEHYLKNRHEIIQEIVAHLGHAMNVFDSQRSASEWLTDASMDSLPIFWFKMHHWQPDDIRFLYDCLGNPRANLEEEIKQCYSGSDTKLKCKCFSSMQYDKKKKVSKNGKGETKFFLFALEAKTHTHTRIRTKKKKAKPQGKQIRRDSKLYLKQQQILIRDKHDHYSSKIWSQSHYSDVLGTQIWDQFVQSRGGVLSCTSVNEDQWNIALNDSGIEVSPDLSLDLYIALLDAKEKIEQQSKEKNMIPSEQ
ncbi:hypothetical protein RFI_25046, partial [Reticulomyxa filosa]